MFNLFKRQPKQMAEEEYQAEYRRLLRELNNQFAIGDSAWEQVVNSMGVIDHEMNGNGLSGHQGPVTSTTRKPTSVSTQSGKQKRHEAKRQEELG